MTTAVVGTVPGIAVCMYHRAGHCRKVLSTCVNVVVHECKSLSTSQVLLVTESQMDKEVSMLVDWNIDAAHAGRG